jgi:transposase-like protein
VIQPNDERFWLYAAVDSVTNRLLHVKLSTRRNQATIEMLLAELHEKHVVDDAVFLVDSSPWL